MARRRRTRHLYRGGAAPRERRAFERRYEAEGYSKARADRIYGATVGKVRREREAKARRGGDMAYGKHAHRHSRGHYGGYCSSMCRTGRSAHRYRLRRHHRRHRY